MALKTWDDWKKEQKKDDDFMKEVEDTVKSFDEEISPGDMKHEFYTKEAGEIPSLIDGGEPVTIPVDQLPPEYVAAMEPVWNKEPIPEELPVFNVLPNEDNGTSISFSKESWMEIQGVGAKLAERLVENGPYASLDEIGKIKGVGKKVLKDIEFVVNQIAPWEDDQQATP